MTTENTPPPAAIERATDVLWRLLPGDVQDGYDRDTVRRWAVAVVEAAGAQDVDRPWCGAPAEYGGQQPCPMQEPCDVATCRLGAAASRETYGPAATDNACPDPHQPAHAAGSHPDHCATCSETRPGQCPRCTSDRRDFRFADPKAPGLLRDAPFCPDPWHDQCGNPNPNDDGRPCTHPAGHTGDHYSRNPDGGIDTWGQARPDGRCGAPGPDGFTCQRPAGHRPSTGDRGYHGATHDAGLVTW